MLLAERPSSVECAQLLAFGASACLAKTTQSRDVLNAIHLASRGLQLTPRGGHGIAPGSGLLTVREADVLAGLQQRRSNAQIAADLHISIETVRTHARHIYRKLGVASRRELLAPSALSGEMLAPASAPARGPG
jgi:DNA-binding NarL/FixJ family response regulator